MKFKSYILTFTITIFLSVVLITNSYGLGELKIGVVNLSSVFEKYTKREEFDKQLKALEKGYEKTVNEKRETIMMLREEAGLLDMGSESRNKKEEEIQKRSIDMEVFAKFAEQNLLKKYKEYFEDIYVDVTKEVKIFAKENNYDLIFKNEEPELISKEISDLQFKIGIKSVLYYSDAVDITPQIIEIINKRYSSNGKK